MERRIHPSPSATTFPSREEVELHGTSPVASHCPCRDVGLRYRATDPGQTE